MLLVRDGDGRIVGLVTSRDIEGEKPGRILAKAGGDWEGLRVADIMTLKPKLEVLLMDDVLNARVGDIISTLRQMNRQHAMAVDTDPATGKPAVRGIFRCRKSVCYSGWTSIPRTSRPPSPNWSGPVSTIRSPTPTCCPDPSAAALPAPRLQSSASGPDRRRRR